MRRLIAMAAAISLAGCGLIEDHPQLAPGDFRVVGYTWIDGAKYRLVEVRRNGKVHLLADRGGVMIKLDEWTEEKQKHE